MSVSRGGKRTNISSANAIPLAIHLCAAFILAEYTTCGSERTGKDAHTLPSTKRLVSKLFRRGSSSELLDHAIEIGIARAKAPCQPIPTALGNPLAVSDNLELTGLPRRNDGFNVEALLDEGHETRDLGLVVLSRWAVNDLDLHSALQSALCSHLWLMVRRDDYALQTEV